MTQESLQRLAEKTMDGELLAFEDAIALTEIGHEHLAELLHWADCIRRHFFGCRISFCCITPGRVGGCDQDCAWCAQSVANQSSVEPSSWRPDQEWLMDLATRVEKSKAACFCVVSSGRRPRKGDLEVIETLNRNLLSAGLPRACASLGELDVADAERLRKAGVVRYNHNLETSRSHFGRVVGTHAYDDRMVTLRIARATGMDLCCGGIFGIGEAWSDRIELALTLRDEIRPVVVPLNFLDACPGTPLAEFPALAPLECLHVVALYRFLLPKTDIKIAGGRRMLRDLRSWVFHAGATSLLVGDYLTTSGRPIEDDLQMIHDLGLELAT